MEDINYYTWFFLVTGREMSEKCINVEHNGKIHRLLDVVSITYISIGYIIGIFKVHGRENLADPNVFCLIRYHTMYD